MNIKMYQYIFKENQEATEYNFILIPYIDFICYRHLSF